MQVMLYLEFSIENIPIIPIQRPPILLHSTDLIVLPSLSQANCCKQSLLDKVVNSAPITVPLVPLAMKYFDSIFDQ